MIKIKRGDKQITCDSESSSSSLRAAPMRDLHACPKDKASITNPKILLTCFKRNKNLKQKQMKKEKELTLIFAYWPVTNHAVVSMEDSLAHPTNQHYQLYTQTWANIYWNHWK